MVRDSHLPLFEKPHSQSELKSSTLPKKAGALAQGKALYSKFGLRCRRSRCSHIRTFRQQYLAPAMTLIMIRVADTCVV